MKTKRIAALAVGASVVLAVAGCSSSGGSAGEDVTINWWTWDPNQAAAYEECIPLFEEENPGIDVKFSQYGTDAGYFTKLTAGFVAGDAPDAFMNPVTFLEAYASQGQLLPLDEYIERDDYPMDSFGVGVDAWKFTDGQQYGLPMDWAAPAFFYNKAMVADAGISEEEINGLTWTPDDGGSFLDVIKRLTVDANGVRGDESGFDPNNVAVYGLGTMESNDNLGQANWGPFPTTTDFRYTDKAQWPTQFNYGDPDFIATMDFVRTIADQGYTPKIGQFTLGDTEQLGTERVAMVAGGSWVAPTFAKLPGIEVGIAPTVSSPDGKRSIMSNTNANVIWAGTEHPEETWKWVAFQESEECQTAAATSNGSFLPSNLASSEALFTQMGEDGVDMSVFLGYQQNGELYASPAYANGGEMESTLRPQFEAYFLHQEDNDLWPRMQEQSREIIANAASAK